MMWQFHSSVKCVGRKSKQQTFGGAYAAIKSAKNEGSQNTKRLTEKQRVLISGRNMHGSENQSSASSAGKNYSLAPIKRNSAGMQNVKFCTTVRNPVQVLQNTAISIRGE